MLQKGALNPVQVARMPLYMGLARRLNEGLQRGQWQVEGALPSERVLAEVLAVSRDTARKALGLLCKRGMLVRVRGSGTYLRAMPAGPMSAAAGQQGERLVASELQTANLEEQRTLDLAPGQSVWRAVTLSPGEEAGGRAHQLKFRCIPQHFLPRHIEPAKLGLAELELHFQLQGLGGTYLLQRIEAVAATLPHAVQMGIAPGTALLHVQRLRCAPLGQALEIEHGYRLGVEAGFCVELRVAAANPVFR
ncbi:GntR family transcriptional regulator [Roseateles oligotrophus]|uniref:GntR family transcriptional regulator n=1 Tax=Roseateles oligotrophus TaxID=1769250 RepID=A0ABT2YKC1_9BURK|nr:GntR family transcriptional regulator [Roseateles oligotrophus]MCV2370502.1 GntR family transcriptional regulator [Roseateles oligotrophus]